MTSDSIQRRFFADGMCFGCGPANAKGLHLESAPQGVDALEAWWTPDEHHQAFEGVLNGGIIGTLLDCHSAWTAWWTLYNIDGIQNPFTVTAEYTIKLLRPTPLRGPLHLSARGVEAAGRRVRVEGSIDVDGVAHATSTGTFIRPKEGFHR